MATWAQSLFYKSAEPEQQITPSTYGLPHDEWRPNQLETIKWLQDKQGYCIVEAPVGSGKTSLAAALSTPVKKSSWQPMASGDVMQPAEERTRRVIALCATKNLQSENYGNGYDFEVLFGKGNYECVNPKYASKIKTADKCPYAHVEGKGGMKECPDAKRCPYLVAKYAAIESNKTSLNYPYYIATRWPKERQPDYLFLDEAHELPDITLEWAGITVSNKTRQFWNLPEFPRPSAGVLFLSETAQVSTEEMIADWLKDSISTLTSQAKYSNPTTDPNFLPREKLIRKLSSTARALESNPHDWYIQIGYENSILTLTCKPLSARNHFRFLFNEAKTIVLMSATIGNVEAFSDELGIPQYHFKTIESQWLAEQRPVVDLKAPKIGQRSTLDDYDEQARVIAEAILKCPPEWSGVIHITRKAEAGLLGERLARHGLQNRIWIPRENTGTEQQMQDWKRAKRRGGFGAGKIALTWTWWAGVDLTEERICIVAKTPFPTLGDPYEAARMRRYGKLYLWRTAVKMEQGLGRTRRGEPEDYDLNGQRNQLVAIADGNWVRCKSHLSPSLLSAITQL